MSDFVEMVRKYEKDHGPNGWPAIKMKHLLGAAAELASLRAELAAVKQENERLKREREKDISNAMVTLRCADRPADPVFALCVIAEWGRGHVERWREATGCQTPAEAQAKIGRLQNGNRWGEQRWTANTQEGADMNKKELEDEIAFRKWLRTYDADWLVENCPLGAEWQQWTDRAEFIRCQVAMATCRMCNRKDGTKRKDGYSRNCGRCVPLRRREHELLSACVEEPCQRCDGRGGSSYGFHGPAFLCGACRGTGSMQVSNAVRWAGPLGGRQAVMLNEHGEGPWHVGWAVDIMRGAGESLCRGAFDLGFIGRVELPTAALMGERCGRCGEAGWKGCPHCHGTGYVGGLREELAKMPLLGVELSDKRPECRAMTETPHWSRGGDDPCALPYELYDSLENKTGNITGFDSASAANAALSRALCAWVRKAGKQEPAHA